MGTVIRSVGFAKPTLLNRGTIGLQTKAAKECCKKGNINPNDLGILINAGLYREEHLGEPAIASFLQRKLGANPLFDEAGSTFAFDLYNGGVGMISGMQVIQSLIESGVTDNGIVITGDANPTPGFTVGFEFMPSAGAVIVGKGKGEGFVNFDEYTFTEYKDSFKSSIEWTNLGAGGRKRHILVIKKRSSYLKDCLDSSRRALRSYLRKNYIKKSEIDMVITSQSPTIFPSKLAELEGLNGRIVDVTPQMGNLHTSGPAAALDKVFWNGEFKEAKNVLFLAVGSGITVALALYRN